MSRCASGLFAVCATIICMLAVATQASAEVVLLSQSRSVYAEGDFFEPHSGSLSAPDFGLFNETIRVGEGDFYAGTLYWLTATQNSEIQTGHFSIHGDTDGRSYQLQGDYFGGDARSDFEVLFEVTVPTPFILIGSLAPWGGGGGTYSTATSSLHLDWNGAPYLSFSSGYNQEEIVVSENGILEPGVYTLTVNAMVMVLESDFSGPFTSSFDIDFYLGAAVPVEEMGVSQVKAMFR